MVLKMIFLAVLFTILCVIIVLTNKYIKDKEANEFTERVSKLGEEVKKKIVATKIERAILDKIKMDPDNEMAVIIFRISVIGMGIIMSITMSLSVYLFFIAEVMIIFYFDGKYTEKVNNTGINSLFNTSRFLDVYIPSISSGTSVDQAMINFIEKEKDASLLDWWYNKNGNAPVEWRDCIKIYENSKHSEELGYSDNSSKTQADILMKIDFFNQLQKGIDETKSISTCFIFFLPIIIIMSFTNSPDFWKSALGYVDTLGLVALFFTSQFLLYNEKKKILEKLF